MNQSADDSAKLLDLDGDVAELAAGWSPTTVRTPLRSMVHFGSARTGAVAASAAATASVEDSRPTSRVILAQSVEPLDAAQLIRWASQPQQ
jgi:hypothetical protein